MARKKTIIAACLGVFTGAIVTFFAMNVVMAHVEYVQDKKNASEVSVEAVEMTPLQRMKLAVWKTVIRRHSANWRIFTAAGMISIFILMPD